MTYQKLSIRPELFIGESLTSYLLRVAKAYKTSMKEVWKWYGDGNLWNFSKIDFYLSPTLNMDKIFAHMDKVAEQISSATFFALLESMHESNDQSKWGFLGVSLNSKHRRYCPKCIKELKSYNLIWQVQEIQICVKHQVYLQDSCLNCNHVIPYIHDLLSYGKCPNCSHSLSLKSRSCTIIEDIQFQESIYRQWLYMLNNPFIQSEYGNILNKGRYIATKLLFIAQNRETIMHRGRMNLTSDEISGLLSYIKDDEKLVKKYLVTLPRVLRIIRSRNIDIETLYELKVPKSYVRSIFDEGKEQELIGTCLAPWCPSFEQTRGLIALYYRSDTFRVQNEKYKLPHICMYCSLKYGLNQSGEWVESEGVIQTAYHGALPLLNAGVGVSKVAKKFNTDRFMVYRMIAYMIYHKLLNENAMEKFATIKIEKEPVKYFRLLSEIKGSKLVYARKNFGWNQVEYYFHYFHSSVQLFLHEAYLSENYVLSHEENEKKIKKRKKVLRSDGDVEIKQKEEIWFLAKQYVAEKGKKYQTAIDLQFYQYIGKGEKWLKSNLPELLGWYILNKTELQEKSGKYQKSERLIKYLSTLCELYVAGLPISQELISKESGIPRKYMRINGLMLIVNIYKEALLCGCLSIKELQDLLKENPGIEQWEGLALKWNITLKGDQL